MKYKITTDKDNNIIYAGACETENNPQSTFLELDSVDYEKLNFSKLINGKIVLDEEKYQAEQFKKEIAKLKKELTQYDYIGTKIAMGVATKEDYANEIAHTEEIRKQIRLLEGEVK